MKPLVSIITVNFNQTEVTISLLKSLREITYKNIEVFVVDNASKENPYLKIKELFPEVKVILSKVNLGFAGGNNLAIEQAKGKYMMFLNNDTEVKPDFLEPLVEVMEKDNHVGICSSKLIFYTQPDTIQFAGSSPLHPIKIQSFAVGYGQKDSEKYSQTVETALAHGAAMLVRSEAISKAGKMPEEYFLYYEEIDWCERIKKEGFKIMFVPDSVVLHKESISIGKQSFIQVFYKTRNRILLARKLRKGFEKIISLAYLTATVFRDILKYFTQRKNDLALASWKAWLWNIQN
jgi:GT2 family glycosyltransferase